MKDLVCIFLIIVYGSVFSINAQEKGEEYFKKGEYASAIKAYEKELKKAKKKPEQAKIEGRLGICYYHINKPVEAAERLKKSISLGSKSAEIYGTYGLSLQKTENYKEALDAFNQCLNTDAGYPGINLYIASCNYALEHPEPNEHIVLRSSKINTDGSEFGISPGPDGDIFFSRAPVKGRIDPRTGMAYVDVLVVKFEGTDLTKPKKEKAFMKSFYNTGVFSYDSRTNHIYMTVCDPKGKCGIYRSAYNRQKWGKPEPALVNENFDIAHPALSKDGNRIYFTSNSPGGYGKTDIWYANRIDENGWSEPINAGNKINTSEREEFPYIEGDLIYFASDGHSGFGGLDIFWSTINGNDMDVPMNLGRPFNGGADDFNLTTVGEKGLLISSRNIKTGDDIYIFAKADLTKTEIVEKEEEPESITIEPEPVIVVVPESPEPEPVVIPMIEPEKPKTNNLSVIYFDFNRFVPQREFRSRYDEIAAQMKAYPNATFEIAGYADPRGGTEFNAELSDKRAEYIAKRLIDRGVSKSQLIIKGYGFNDPAAPNATTEEEFRMNRRVEIRIIKTSN